MPNTYFQFKQFIVNQEGAAMKVCTDACLFGAWVADLIERQTTHYKNVLDIGAGTGLLSLMVAQKSAAFIDAIEIDRSASMQAADNFFASPWKERLRLLHADVKTMKADKQYDLIISNPPFFENDLKSLQNERNVALHSEALTLEELLKKAKELLLPNGKFAVLLPYLRHPTFIDSALKQELFVSKQVLVKQTEKHNYFRSMLWLSKRESEIEQLEIVIRRNGEYSNEFTFLLKDFYLHL